MDVLVPVPKISSFYGLKWDVYPEQYFEQGVFHSPPKAKQSELLPPTEGDLYRATHSTGERSFEVFLLIGVKDEILKTANPYLQIQPGGDLDGA